MVEVLTRLRQIARDNQRPCPRKHDPSRRIKPTPHVGQGLSAMAREPKDELTYIELAKEQVALMSRSRGRSKAKIQPKTKSQAKPTQVQPFLMFQIFNRLPWVQVKWHPQGVPKHLDCDALVSELVGVIRKHMAAAEAARHAEGKVRVSGVPYAVDLADGPGRRVEPETKRQEYPH